MRKTARLVVALVASIQSISHAQGEVIDRVLAIAAGQIVTQSDVDAAIALGLVDSTNDSGRPGSVDGRNAQGRQDRRGAALQELIERELILREVRRYMPADPSEQDVDRRLDTIRQRFANAGEMTRALERSGMDEARLRELLRDELRIEAYLDERFASPAQPTEDDLAAYYKQHLADFTRAGQTLSLSEVRELVRQRVADERRTTMIRDWVAGLRRRAEVIELSLPGR